MNFIEALAQAIEGGRMSQEVVPLLKAGSGHAVEGMAKRNQVPVFALVLDDDGQPGQLEITVNRSEGSAPESLDDVVNTFREAIRMSGSRAGLYSTPVKTSDGRLGFVLTCDHRDSPCAHVLTIVPELAGGQLRNLEANMSESADRIFI